MSLEARWLWRLESKLEAKWLYLPYSFLNELNWKGQCVLEILLNGKMICNGGRAHESSPLAYVNRREAGYMLGKLFCVFALLILPVARQLRRYPLKWQNSPSSLFSCLFPPLYYILGHSMALHWPERQSMLSCSGFSHGRCAGPLLGLAVVLSLVTTPSLIVHTLQQLLCHF